MDAQALPATSPRLRPLAGLRALSSTDETLAALVGRGSERAFVALYERYHQPLYRYCRSMVREEADAQDALQSTFASAFSALRRSRRDAPLRPWLYRIAHNESVSLLRRRRSHDELGEAHEQSGPSLEDRVAERDRLATLVTDLRALPERQRGALVMRELSGLPYDEIAAALGMATDGVKQTIFGARRALGEFEAGRGMTCDEICRTLSNRDRRQLRNRRIQGHLRHCSACAAFSQGIGARPQQLQALVPVLPAGAAAGILSQVLGAGGSSVAGGSTVAAAGAGKAIGGAVAAKLAGLAVVATAVVAVATGWRVPIFGHSPARSAQRAGGGSSGAGTGAGAGGYLMSPDFRLASGHAVAGSLAPGGPPMTLGRPGSLSAHPPQTLPAPPAASAPAASAAPSVAGIVPAGSSSAPSTPQGAQAPVAAGNSAGPSSPTAAGPSAPAGVSPTSAADGSAPSQPTGQPQNVTSSGTQGTSDGSFTSPTRPGGAQPSSPTPAHRSAPVTPIAAR